MNVGVSPRTRLLVVVGVATLAALTIGCESDSRSLTVELQPSLDAAAARQCPEGESLAATVVRSWAPEDRTPLAALHVSDPESGTWWLDEQASFDSVRLSFAADGEEQPSFVKPWSVGGIGSVLDWELFAQAGERDIWTVARDNGQLLYVCRTDPVIVPAETKCGVVVITSGSNPATWHRSFGFVEGQPYTIATRRTAVPFDEGSYCVNNLDSSSEDLPYTPVEFPQCTSPILETLQTLTTSETIRETQLFFVDSGGTRTDIDAGSLVTVEASVTVDQDGSWVSLVELGAGYGETFPHLTRFRLDSGGLISVNQVSSEEGNLPTTESPDAHPWSLQLGMTPGQFVVAQTTAYDTRLLFADRITLEWRPSEETFSFAGHAPLAEFPRLIQLEDFPILVSLHQPGALLRVDTTPATPLIAIDGFVTAQQAGRGHLLAHREDGTAALLKIACALDEPASPSP